VSHPISNIVKLVVVIDPTVSSAFYENKKCGLEFKYDFLCSKEEAWSGFAQESQNTLKKAYFLLNY
jgi:hypothetical protein